MVSPPFLAHLSHSPSLSSVVARLGTYPDRVCLATCTNLKLLVCPGAISPKPYAFVTPLLASWAILPCRVLAVQDSLAPTRAACCQLQFFVCVVPWSWAFLTSLLCQNYELLAAYNYPFILFLL